MTSFRLILDRFDFFGIWKYRIIQDGTRFLLKNFGGHSGLPLFGPSKAFAYKNEPMTTFFDAQSFFTQKMEMFAKKDRYEGFKFKKTFSTFSIFFLPAKMM